MKSGKELRGKTEIISDLLTDIAGFLEEKGQLTSEIANIICKMQKDCEDLFYTIPLEK